MSNFNRKTILKTNILPNKVLGMTHVITFKRDQEMTIFAVRKFFLLREMEPLCISNCNPSPQRGLKPQAKWNLGLCLQ